MAYRALFAAALAACSFTSANAGEVVIGLSGALTGPTAGSYAPAIDAMRIYFDRLNKAGGVNGTTVRLILQDDQGEASKGAANAKKLLSQDKVDILINASLSSTYAPMIAETKRAKVPLLFAASVCPEQTYPPAEANLFCTTAFAAKYDSRATLDFIESQAKSDVQLGLVAMAIPVSRAEIDYAETIAPENGMQAVAKEVIPPPTPDYSPFASNIKNAGANWVYAWAPWVTEVKTLEALRQQGWEGDYITWAHLEAEGEAERLKDGKLFLIGANSFFSDGLPIHEEIVDAAKEAGSSYPPEKMVEGWIAGMAIEAAISAAGPDADAGKLMAAMSDLKVDTKGLRGGPIAWTKDNHFRTTQYYRVYGWGDGGIETVMDWKPYNVE